MLEHTLPPENLYPQTRDFVFGEISDAVGELDLDLSSFLTATIKENTSKFKRSYATVFELDQLWTYTSSLRINN